MRMHTTDVTAVFNLPAFRTDRVVKLSSLPAEETADKESVSRELRAKLSIVSIY